MSFASLLALLVVFAVGLPIAAHRLRRRRQEQFYFAATRLIPTGPEDDRARSRIEDRPLLLIRVLSILALAILGATPFVRCSRLGIQRDRGASVATAIVLDDSLSMRAKEHGATRFLRAKKGALEVLASLQEGDSVAVIVAGRPARVVLAPTSNLSLAKDVLERTQESDRATDLEAALASAEGVLAPLPQRDRQIVVFSDRADGSGSAAPVGASHVANVWFPLVDWDENVPECGILRAEPRGGEIEVHVRCAHGRDAAGRKIEIVSGKDVLASVLLEEQVRDEHTPVNITRRVPLSGRRDNLTVGLVPADAIEADDHLPVLQDEREGSVGVLSERMNEVRSGRSAAEQALAALAPEIALAPLTVFPEDMEELRAHAGLVVDDPPGFTPEQRGAIRAYMRRGGIFLVSLGPKAASPPLGSTLDPLLTSPIQWEGTTARGARATSSSLLASDSASSLADLGAKFRARLSAEDAKRCQSLLEWEDGEPFLCRVLVDHGEAWVVTLPLQSESSDLVVRPGFLAILDAWRRAVEGKRSLHSSEPGTIWSFSEDVAIDGPPGRVETRPDARKFLLEPNAVGLYRVRNHAGEEERRIVVPNDGEIDLRPRPLAKEGAGLRAGRGTPAAVDASWVIAWGLLALFSLELSLRFVRRGRVRETFDPRADDARRTPVR